MAVNYLQYINSFNVGNGGMPVSERFLVSGADPIVRQIVGQNIVSSAYNKRKTLFIVNNTKSSTSLGSDLGSYRVVNALDSCVDLCGDLLNTRSIRGITRLRSLLADLGFDEQKIMKVISYLEFVRETQLRLGEPTDLTVEILEEYSSMMLVDWKLRQLVDSFGMSEANYNHLLGVYSEISGAAADFEKHLALLSPFLSGIRPTTDMALNIEFGELNSDQSLKLMLSRLLISYIKQNAGSSALLILDDGNGDCEFIPEILKNIPVNAEVHMISKDAFTLGESGRSILINSFPIRIYTRHDNMSSCAAIESICGEVDVVKYSKTVTYDRRLKSNSAWDMLFGTNRTEATIANAPTKESLFRKEVINTISEGTGIIDCGGNKVLFSFL